MSSARMPLLLATRNAGKIDELTALLRAYPQLQPVTLDELGLSEAPEEAAIEAYSTFEQNARAKALHFARLSGTTTLADDSGLRVNVLGGAPGVHSRRFAPGPALRGEEQDAANNRHLLALLATEVDRAAEYVCSVAIAWPDGESVCYTRCCEGQILEAPRGAQGFGYDPLFFVPATGTTFAEIPLDRKNLLSHRGSAVRAAADFLAAQG